MRTGRPPKRRAQGLEGGIVTSGMFLAFALALVPAALAAALSGEAAARYAKVFQRACSRR
ncbi:MAG: hypothetical protein EXR47_08465 [Dehalococcoidia bacterium]|nr:hypothetical protein [Dehalococcoidia bacterium]